MENLLVNSEAERQRTESLSEDIVGSHIVLFLAFSLEAVYHVKTFSFMVSPGQVHAFIINKIPRNIRRDTFHRERASVNEIPVHQVWVICRRVSIHLKYVQKIKILSVSITTHCQLLFTVNTNLHHIITLTRLLDKGFKYHSEILLM